jgi:hypothetical protein
MPKNMPHLLENIPWTQSVQIWMEIQPNNFKLCDEHGWNLKNENPLLLGIIIIFKYIYIYIHFLFSSWRDKVLCMGRSQGGGIPPNKGLRTRW